MATESQKVTLTELAAAGYIVHEVAQFLSKGNLQKAEINTFIRIMKKAVPWVARTVGRGIARAPGTVGMLAMRHPYIAGGAAVYVAYHNRDEIADLLNKGYVFSTDQGLGPQREQFRPGPAMVPIGHFPVQDPGVPAFPPGLVQHPGTMLKQITRKVSRANKAVKKGMELMKKGRKGKKVSPKQQKAIFRLVTKAAGMANPNTKSKIGKGNTPIKKMARKLKKWW